MRTRAFYGFKLQSGPQTLLPSSLLRAARGIRAACVSMRTVPRPHAKLQKQCMTYPRGRGGLHTCHIKDGRHPNGAWTSEWGLA